jgi:hypothetical protein
MHGSGEAASAEVIGRSGLNLEWRGGKGGVGLGGVNSWAAGLLNKAHESNEELKQSTLHVWFELWMRPGRLIAA